MEDDSTKRPALRWLIGGLAILLLFGGGVLIWRATRAPVHPPEVAPARRVEPDAAPISAITREDAAQRKDVVVRRSHKATAPRRPTVRLAPRELRLMQRRYRPLINACYRRAVGRVPELTAMRADIAVTVAEGGEIRSIDVNAGGDQELEGCLRRVVRGFRFPSTLMAQQVLFPVILK